MIKDLKFVDQLQIDQNAKNLDFFLYCKYMVFILLNVLLANFMVFINQIIKHPINLEITNNFLKKIKNLS